MASQLIPVHILWHKCHANAYSYVQGHTGEGKTAKKPLNASHYLSCDLAALVERKLVLRTL